MKSSGSVVPSYVPNPMGVGTTSVGWYSAMCLANGVVEAATSTFFCFPPLMEAYQLSNIPLATSGCRTAADMDSGAACTKRSNSICRACVVELATAMDGSGPVLVTVVGAAGVAPGCLLRKDAIPGVVS